MDRGADDSPCLLSVGHGSTLTCVSFQRTCLAPLCPRMRLLAWTSSRAYICLPTRRTAGTISSARTVKKKLASHWLSRLPACSVGGSFFFGKRHGTYEPPQWCSIAVRSQTVIVSAGHNLHVFRRDGSRLCRWLPEYNPLIFSMSANEEQVCILLTTSLRVMRISASSIGPELWRNHAPADDVALSNTELFVAQQYSITVYSADDGTFLRSFSFTCGSYTESLALSDDGILEIMITPDTGRCYVEFLNPDGERTTKTPNTRLCTVKDSTSTRLVPISIPDANSFSILHGPGQS